MDSPWECIRERAKNTPLLSAEEERELFARYKKNGDRDAMNRIVMGQSRRVFKTILEMAHDRVTKHPDLFPEFFNVGMTGVLFALMRFDPDKGRLSSIAYYWVREMILRHIHSLPTVKGMSLSHMYNIRNKTGQLPDKKIMFPPALPLGDPIPYKDNSTEFTWADMLISEEETPEELAEWSEVKTILSKAMNILTDRERVVIQKRFLNDEKTAFNNIGELFGVTGERIRQVEEKALKKLGKHLDFHYPGVRFASVFSK